MSCILARQCGHLASSVCSDDLVSIKYLSRGDPIQHNLVVMDLTLIKSWRRSAISCCNAKFVGFDSRLLGHDRVPPIGGRPFATAWQYSAGPPARNAAMCAMPFGGRCCRAVNQRCSADFRCHCQDTWRDRKGADRRAADLSPHDAEHCYQRRGYQRHCRLHPESEGEMTELH
jgi:hypothetical protein